MILCLFSIMNLLSHYIIDQCSNVLLDEKRKKKFYQIERLFQLKRIILFNSSKNRLLKSKKPVELSIAIRIKSIFLSTMSWRINQLKLTSILSRVLLFTKVLIKLESLILRNITQPSIVKCEIIYLMMTRYSKCLINLQFCAQESMDLRDCIS